MNDTDLIAEFRRACDAATTDVHAGPIRVTKTARRRIRSRWTAPIASAALAVGAALGAVALQGQLGATAHRPDAQPLFAGVCDGPYDVPAPAGHLVTNRFPVGDIVVGPAATAPTPAEDVVRSRLRTLGVDLPLGAQVRWASITEPGMSPKASEHWLITSCGQAPAPMRPTPGDPSPMSRIYPTATYSIVTDSGRAGQPFTSRLDQPACPHRIGPLGQPSNAHPRSDRIFDGGVTGGVFCRYYSVIPSPRNKYPGIEHGVSGITPDLAVGIADAINALQPPGLLPYSCPADIGVTDVISLQTNKGQEQVWVSATGCAMFRNGKRVALGSGPGMTTYLRLRSRLVLPPVQ